MLLPKKKLGGAKVSKPGSAELNGADRYAKGISRYAFMQVTV